MSDDDRYDDDRYCESCGRGGLPDDEMYGWHDEMDGEVCYHCVELFEGDDDDDI